MGEHWFGIYAHGEKIGHAHRKVDPVVIGQDTFYDMQETVSFNLRVMDILKKIETTLDARHSGTLQLLSFNARIVADATLDISGSREGSEFRISLVRDGRKSEITVLPGQDPSLDLSIVPRLLSTGLKEDMEMHIPVLDPATQRVREMTIQVKGKEQVISRGTVREAFRIQLTSGESALSFWITENGEVLRQELPLGFTLLREDREDALKEGISSPDLVSFLSVPFSRNLHSGLRSLRVRITGIDPSGLELDGGRQRFRGDILEITREVLHDPSLPTDRLPDRKYLESAAFIQADSPEIESLAAELTAGLPDAAKKAEALSTWVYRAIEKVPAVTVPDALEVLQTRKGDCNEHATLFTALARASGIPARIAVGLVYREGAFFYHAWPEFFQGRWIAVDPTFGQFPADVTHIRLMTGDLHRQMQIIRLMGKIRIEGLEDR